MRRASFRCVITPGILVVRRDQQLVSVCYKEYKCRNLDVPIGWCDLEGFCTQARGRQAEDVALLAISVSASIPA